MPLNRNWGTSIMGEIPEAAISGTQLDRWRDRAIAEAAAVEIDPQEIDWLLCELAGLDRLSLRLKTYRDRPRVPLRISLDTLDRLWQRRLHQREPVQYLAGVAPWREFSLAVSPQVLIPRPETEYLIDLVQRAVGNSDLAGGHWADLGTGSGAIALGLARVLPEAIVHAIDTSETALEIARNNAGRARLGDRIQFRRGSWFEPLAALDSPLNGMVSNPPYIPTAEIPRLQPEVARHEPHQALDGGADGLDCIRHLVATAPNYVRSGGIWAIEMMAGQADAVVQLLRDRGGYGDIRIEADLTGIERFAIARLKN